MKNVLPKCVAGLALACSLSVSAAPVTDTVIIGSQEWAQVDLFTNVSWNTLNAQCPGGVCSLSSTINGYDLDGWTWAALDTVQALFNSFTGQALIAPSYYTTVNSTWAPEFFALFNATDSSNFNSDTLGWSATVDSSGDGSAPRMYDYYNTAYKDIANTANFGRKENTLPWVGAWFVRDADPAPIPAPATLALFGLGLASLWATRRKRGAKV